MPLARIAIRELQERRWLRPFAIIDTDAHHGDGTWELFENRPEVLYVCFCSQVSQETNGNINIHVPCRTKDEGYLHITTDLFDRWIKAFGPEIIFWTWGYDGTVGEYGDMGLTPELHVQLALEIRKLVEEVCHRRLIVILCRGSRRDLTSFLILRVIGRLIGCFGVAHYPL